jgi:hypothetical protein
MNTSQGHRYIVQSFDDFFQVIDRRNNSPVFFPANLEDHARCRTVAENYASNLNRLVVEAERRAGDRRTTERRSWHRRTTQRRLSNRATSDRRRAERRNGSRRAPKRRSSEHRAVGHGLSAGLSGRTACPDRLGVVLPTQTMRTPVSLGFG